MAKRKPHHLHVPPLPLAKFSWNAATRTLTAEDSDLRDRPFDGTIPWLFRLYSDACDAGIAIKSHHTGEVERFYLVGEDRTPDGEEIAGWRFKPEDPAACKVREVLIIND